MRRFTLKRDGGQASATLAERGRRDQAQGTRVLVSVLLLWLLVGPVLAEAVDEADLLLPDAAFAVTAEAASTDRVLVHWDIADGYYLYQHSLGANALTPGYSVGEPSLPAGEVKEDEFFGRVVTYRGRLTMEVPVSRQPGTGESLDLELRSQGCADLGVCYPPHTQQATVRMPTLAAADMATPASSLQTPDDALGVLLGEAGRLPGEPELLDPEVAFRPVIESPDPRTLVVRWTIAEGYYLYRDKLGIKLPDGAGARVISVQTPPGELKEDEFFGRMEVYHYAVTATAALQRTEAGAKRVEARVSYQGCAEIGVCYPPQQSVLPVMLAALGAGNEVVDPTAVVSTVAPSVDAAPPTPTLSEQDRLAAVIADAGPLITTATFFGFGLLLTFTPCVLPMIPILSGIIVGQGRRLGSGHAFLLSLVFVLAMAATYTLAGVLAGLFGANLQAAFQNPWVLTAFAAVFVALALSMFGFYDLQVPAALQSRLAELSNRQRGGTYLGAGIMGFLSALIVGPCVAPPLMGALIYIGQTGDAVLGGSALFALSMGMGAPLLALGASAGKLLPKAGPWMGTIKAVFGVLLLAVAIYLLERIVPAAAAMLMWGVLLVVSAVYLGAFQSVSGGWHRLWKGLGLVLFTYGALMLIGAAAGGKDTLQPLRGVIGAGAGTEAVGLRFTRIKTEQDLERQVAAAAARGQPTMLDFYADWCVSCKEMEKYTFSDPAVVSTLQRTRLLQADVTRNDERDQALLRRFGLIGPPAILFFGPDGDERPAYRMVGFLDAEEFRDHVRAAVQ